MSRRTEIRDQRLRQRRRTTSITLLVIVGVALITTAFLIAQNNRPVGAIATPAPRAYGQTDGQSIGDPNAPVKIEEFSDFQCPYCRVFHEETFPKILRDYVETGMVYFTYRNFPIVDGRSATKESTNAAKASVCAAQQGKFFEFHDLLFANQTGENIGDFAQRRLYAMADVAGLEANAFDACYRDSATTDTVDQDKAAGLRAGVESTPSFLINGVPFLGAQPYSEFQAAINAALAAAP
jgi:protein-disulfide isomerase